MRAVTYSRGSRFKAREKIMREFAQGDRVAPRLSNKRPHRIVSCIHKRPKNFLIVFVEPAY